MNLFINIILLSSENYIILPDHNQHINMYSVLCNDSSPHLGVTGLYPTGGPCDSTCVEVQ